MKMKTIYKTLPLLAATALMLTACSEDVDIYGGGEEYSTNFAYIYQPNETFATLDYKANGNAINAFSDDITLMPVRLTKAAPADVTVSVGIDETLVAEYNEAKGTNYAFLSGASVANGQILVRKGEYVSDESVRVLLDPSHQGFMTGAENYILPVVITSTTAGGEIAISKSSRIFLTFNANYIQNYVTAGSQAIYIDADVPTWRDDFREVTLEGIATATYAPYEDVTVALEIDGSLVDSYNQANGTDYTFMADASLAAATATIGTGSQSGSIVLRTGDLSAIPDGGSYLIPVRVKSVSGASVKLREGGDVAYVEITGKKPEITHVSAPVGTEYTYSDDMEAWDNSGDNYYPYYALLGEEYWYATAGDNITIDLKETIRLQSLCFTAYSAYYYPAQLRLEVSADGNTWTDYGTADGTRAKYNYFELSKPASARYLRVTVVQAGPWGTYLLGMKLYTK